MEPPESGQSSRGSDEDRSDASVRREVLRLDVTFPPADHIPSGFDMEEQSLHQIHVTSEQPTNNNVSICWSATKLTEQRNDRPTQQWKNNRRRLSEQTID